MLAKLTASLFWTGALALCLLLLLLSCTEEKRHEVLTFFFDGVPPLGGYPRDVSGPQIKDPNTPVDPNAPPPVVWSIHEPQRECVQCHGKTKKRRFSRAVQLVAEVPDLCYQCHPDMIDPSGWVHGPVAIGVCTFCHDPHKTRNPHLLKYPVPDLCYRCHDQAVTTFIDTRHGDESYSNCIRCHEGHASENHSLLKKDWQETVSDVF